MKALKVNWHLSKMLIYLGISPSNVGYRYIKEIIIHNTNNDCQKLKDVYLTIARSYNQTPKLIEASVRNAIKRANNNDIHKRLESLMGKQIVNKNYSVTVAEFFGLMTTYLKYSWDGTDIVPAHD